MCGKSRAKGRRRGVNMFNYSSVPQRIPNCDRQMLHSLKKFDNFIQHRQKSLRRVQLEQLKSREQYWIVIMNSRLNSLLIRSFAHFSSPTSLMTFILSILHLKHQKCTKLKLLIASRSIPLEA